MICFVKHIFPRLLGFKCKENGFQWLLKNTKMKSTFCTAICDNSLALFCKTPTKGKFRQQKLLLMKISFSTGIFLFLLPEEAFKLVELY